MKQNMQLSLLERHFGFALPLHVSVSASDSVSWLQQNNDKKQLNFFFAIRDTDATSAFSEHSNAVHLVTLTQVRLPGTLGIILTY